MLDKSSVSLKYSMWDSVSNKTKSDILQADLSKKRIKYALNDVFGKYCLSVMTVSYNDIKGLNTNFFRPK